MKDAADDLALIVRNAIAYIKELERQVNELKREAEPVQEPEPAGWFEGPFGEFRANPLHRIAWPAQTVAWSIPLYLAPPQRKPLTDEEIKRLVSNDMVQFARAIERAHGIGDLNG